jgi:hypothetical protein
MLAMLCMGPGNMLPAAGIATNRLIISVFITAYITIVIG